MESSGSLDQHHLIPEVLHQIGSKQFFRCLEKVFLHIKAKRSRTDFLPYTDNLMDTTALHQLRHLPIKQLGSLPGFEHIRQNQGTLSSFIFRTTRHEIKRNVQRSQIRVIAVIDKYTAVLSFLHFQAHGYRFQCRHAFRYFFSRNHQIKSHGQAVQRILNRSLINERNGIFIRHSQIPVTNRSGNHILRYRFDKQRPLIVYTGPSDFFSREQGFRNTSANQIIITIINYNITILEQSQLFHTLVRHRKEILLMGTSDIRQHTNGRTNDALQRLHFSHFGNTRLKDTQFCRFIHQPN